MIRYAFIALSLMLFINASAQWPEQKRLSTWDVPSLEEVELPSNLVDFKAFYDQNRYSNYDECLSYLLDSIGEEVTIFFDSGTYAFQNSIRLKSRQVLLGAGSQLTHFIFDLGGENQHAIHLKGSINSTEISIDGDVGLGEKSIKTSPNNLKKGELIKVGYDDAQDVHNSWAKGSIAQLVTVADIDSNGITINEKSRLGISEKQSPRILKINPVRQSGVANLSITRKDATQGQTSNIRCDFTQDCFFVGLESNLCNFAHIDIRNSYKTIVSGGYFHHGHNYGGGGKAYGVVLEFSSSSCFVASNIFSNLRHSILFQAGSNGNVVYANYSREAYWTDVLSPPSFGGDIVLHGNGPFRNLIEMNVCQNIVIDNSHGKNGRDNLFYRNRAEHAGLFMNCSPASDGQIFLSNEVTGSGFEIHNGIPFPRGLYVLCGLDHLELNNTVQGQLRNPKDNRKDTISFFLKESSEKARIGYPRPNATKILAEERYSTGFPTLSLRTLFDFGFQFVFSNAERNAWDGQHVLLEWETTSLIKGAGFTVTRIGKDTVTLGHVQTKDFETQYTFSDSTALENQAYEYLISYSNRLGFKDITSVSISPIASAKFMSVPQSLFPSNVHLSTVDGKSFFQGQLNNKQEFIHVLQGFNGPLIVHIEKETVVFVRKIWMNP